MKAHTMPVNKPTISAAEAKKPTQRARRQEANSHSLRDLGEDEFEAWEVEQLRQRIRRTGRIQSFKLESL